MKPANTPRQPAAAKLATVKAQLVTAKLAHTETVQMLKRVLETMSDKEYVSPEQHAVRMLAKRMVGL